MSSAAGFVSLVGAGCGSMDLITLRGLERLRRCDAVVYDDLIDEALLEVLPQGAQCFYMGKRSGKHSAVQEEISRTLVRLARSGQTVVRLKGGDPFVFGRGGEEILALQAAGIPYEVIPGVSSAIAIPAMAGIPVTHRGLSRSFHVITAHTAGEDLPEDLPQLASLHGTLVFLMGLSRLEALVQELQSFGTPSNTPAAVISGGNAPHPATVRGTLATIAPRVRAAHVQSPAVIVIGPTAGMDLADGTHCRPLEHLRIGLTGTDSLTDKLRTALQAQGAQPLLVSRSALQPLDFSQALSHIFDGDRHWLVFTSANGVRLFLQACRENEIDLRRLQPCRIAVIGVPTGAVLREAGIIPDLCPDVYTSAALAEQLCSAVRPGEDVFLLRARCASPILPALLHQNAIPAAEVPLYDVTSDHQISERTHPLLDGLDYLTFSSAGGVRQFLKEHGNIPESAMCVCIGPVTAQALAEHYDKPFLTAPRAEVSSMVQTILQHNQNSR